MGSSERALQPHSSGWPSCAVSDPCVAGDSNPKIQVPRNVHVLGGVYINLLPHVTTCLAGTYL